MCPTSAMKPLRELLGGALTTHVEPLRDAGKPLRGALRATSNVEVRPGRTFDVRNLCADNDEIPNP